MVVEPNVAEKIACGIAGWSYPDWDGYVYPASVKDKLAFVSAYIDTVEINSTFYRPPSASSAASWANRIAHLPHFFFTAKLHQEITHKGRLEPGMISAFHDGLQPLVAAGRFKHLLAQFRYDYSDTPANREHLAAIKLHFGDIGNLTFELRHNSWQSPPALDFLASMGVTVTNLDYPTARDSFNLQACEIGEHAYFRLHGRNRKAWFSKAGRDDTYNYLYSNKELDEIVNRAVKLARKSKSLTVIANNHYRGKEFVNALQIKAKLGGTRIPVPPQLLRKYPELEQISA